MLDLCTFCGESELSPTKVTRKNSWRGIRSYLHCSNCDGYTLSPPLNSLEMDTLYRNYYNESPEIEALHILENKFSDLEKYMQAQTDIKDVLDYGCGVDGYLHSRSYNWQIKIDGFEVSAKTLNVLRERYPNSQFFDPESFGTANRRYDLIVLSDVLEHLSNPKELLDSLKPRLKDGGRIWIQQPLENNATFFTLLLKIRIFLTYSRFAEIPPFHVSFASRKSMQIMLQRCEFEIINYKVFETMWPAKKKLDFLSPKNSTLTVIKYADILTSKFLRNYGTRVIFLVKKGDCAFN
jgi:2-polyprenyl-3-methyl-5-hydroxy-6-metoxy-1,4-benzoquinol methylase